MRWSREAEAADARIRRLVLKPAGRGCAAKRLKVEFDRVCAMVEGATESELPTVNTVMPRASVHLETLLNGADTASAASGRLSR